MTDTPAQQESAFFEALGRSIAQWQNLELVLSYLFAMLVTPGNLSLGLLLFNTPTGFREKLKLTDTAARHVWETSPHLQEWSAVRKILNALADERNNLAHGVAGFEHARNEHTLWNAPLMSRKFEPSQTMAVAEIIACGARFEDAARSVAILQGLVEWPH